MEAPWLPSTSSSSHRISGTVWLTWFCPISRTDSVSAPFAPAQPRTKSIVPRKHFFALSCSTPFTWIWEMVFFPVCRASQFMSSRPFSRTRYTMPDSKRLLRPASSVQAAVCTL